MRFCASVFAGAILVVPKLYAQEIETVIVKGQGQSETSLSEVNLEQYTGFAKVLERDAFADRMSSVPELLKSLPSVQVKETAGFGSNAEIALRGSKGKQVNVFVDGLLMNSPFQGNANMQSLPTVLIERIEAYPDFTPLALSNANLAGAVNFHSRDLKPKEKGGQLSLAYGSFNTQQAELSGWADIDGWQLIAAVNQRASDNDYPVADDIFRSKSKTRENDEFDERGGFFKLGKNFGGAKFQLFGQQSKQSKQLATITNSPRDAAFVENDAKRLQLVVDYSKGLWQFNHRALYAKEQNLFNDELGTIGLGKNKTNSEQQALGLVNVASVLLASHELMASLSLQADTLDQKNQLKGLATLDGARKTAVFALADNWYASESLMLNLTLRKFWLHENMEYLQDNKPDVEQSEQYQSYQLGLAYQLWQPLSLKANIGRSIRVPYLFEKFGSVGAFEGNADLQTEQANVFDTGFELNFSQFSLSASAFYKDIENGIYIVYDSRGIGHPMNIGYSKIWGLESQLQVKPADWLELKGNITLLDSENNSFVKSHIGKKMPGVYHENYGATVTFIAGIMRFSTTWQRYDNLYYDPANTVPADQQDVVNSSLTFDIQPVVFDITARNLLDKNYMDFDTMPTPGRSYIATLTVNF